MTINDVQKHNNCIILNQTIQFHFVALRNNIFFVHRARSVALHPIPKLEDQVSVFMCPSELVAQATGSLFVVFYDSQGNGGVFLLWNPNLRYSVHSIQPE
jgi:hypothetical protein